MVIRKEAEARWTFENSDKSPWQMPQHILDVGNKRVIIEDKRYHLKHPEQIVYVRLLHADYEVSPLRGVINLRTGRDLPPNDEVIKLRDAILPLLKQHTDTHPQPKELQHVLAFLELHLTSKPKKEQMH